MITKLQTNLLKQIRINNQNKKKSINDIWRNTTHTYDAIHKGIKILKTIGFVDCQKKGRVVEITLTKKGKKYLKLINKQDLLLKI